MTKEQYKIENMRDLKIFTTNIGDKAKQQIDLLLEQEAFKGCKVRIMPDVHAGSGCVIGFTGNLGDKVIPNIVGVDIGCGMLCVELGNIEIDLTGKKNGRGAYICKCGDCLKKAQKTKKSHKYTRQTRKNILNCE